MRHVDGYVLPVPKKDLPAYAGWRGRRRRSGASMARSSTGSAPEVKQAVAFGIVPFPRRFKFKAGATVVFAWVVFKSRAHRDRVNAKVMNDPRLSKMPAPTPFDVKRMVYGGFKVLVAS